MWMSSELQRESRYDICVEEPERNKICSVPDIEGDFQLMVVFPCDLCPHHHQNNHRILSESERPSDDEWPQLAKNDKHLTDEELDVAAQLMELSSRRLDLVQEMLTTSMFFAVYSILEFSSVPDMKRSCVLTLSPARLSSEKRRKFNVEVDERAKPRSRAVSDIIRNQDLHCTTGAFKRRKAKIRS